MLSPVLNINLKYKKARIFTYVKLIMIIKIVAVSVEVKSSPFLFKLLKFNSCNTLIEL